MVLVYGLLLFYAAKAFFVSHSEMTNNSPYFLGFLFFLISLFRTFTGFDSSQPLSPSAVIGQLGSALLSTIVGLPFRQLLFAYAPAQADQDEFFRTLEEELRRSATQFKKSQAELVDLLQEFIASRELLFSEEEKASKRFVQNMEKTAKVFDHAFENYPTVISTALTESAKGVTKLRNALDELVVNTKELKAPVFIDTLREVEGLRQATADLARQIVSLKESMEGMTQVTEKLPAKIETAFEAARTQSGAAGSKLLEGLKMIEEDVKAVDAILDDFLSVLRSRVAALR